METEGKMKCPFCGSEKIEQYPISGFTLYRIRCSRCKEYLISDELITFSKDLIGQNGYILSGLSRELNETGSKPPEFLEKNLDEWLRHFLIPDIKSVEAKAKKLLLRFKERSEYFGMRIATKYTPDYPLGYAKNVDEYGALIILLNEKGLIKAEFPNTSGTEEKRAMVTVTAKGWEIVSSEYSPTRESDQGFIASWFHESTNESIKAIEETIAGLGFKPMCIKGEYFPDRIMDKALGEIRKSRFVVIDLTGNRASVFFEAGFTFGLGIECFYIYKKSSIEKGSDLEFYVKHYQCYGYENEKDLKEKLRDAIAARIKPKKHKVIYQFATLKIGSSL